ncbi:MAG TPA: hypothetical protein VIJ28_17805 [Chloroflexota bacterium]|jgi:hypothetical protein
MSALEHARAIAAPAVAPSPAPARRSHVVAVVGGALDATVVDLALALAQPDVPCLDLLVLVEVPALFPLRAYGERVLGPAAEEALAAAECSCAEIPGESAIVLCRDLASALVGEMRTRGATDVVVSAPAGSWWRRWRMRRAIARLRARAGCRVYVVHTRLYDRTPGARVSRPAGALAERGGPGDRRP